MIVDRFLEHSPKLALRFQATPTIQDTSSFAGPREFAAFLGLTPKQNSSAASRSSGAFRRWAIAICANCLSWVRMRCCFTASHTPTRCGCGREADRQEALQGCRCGARQQDGAYRVRDHTRHDGLSGNSGVRSAARVRSRGSPRATLQRNRG
jgi:Transposase IS116/IS110/IS902 family